ncbi:MAG TPA: DUF937 domain-containing protein [Roseiarcus sp.]
MAINLVSLVQQFLTPQIVGTLARAVGVNEAVAQKLVAAAVPAILAALGTAAAAPGGAHKVSDAISNSDPDLLSKLSGGNTQLLNEGASLLSGILGGGGLASLTGALSQYAGAPQGTVQPLLGAVTHAAIGTLGQQDPSNWSDPSAIASLFNSQKSAIAAALPSEVSSALGASGLLAGLGGAAAAATQRATSTVSSAATAASSTASSAARSAQAAASSSSGFPTWAIVLIVVVVLALIYWYWQSHQAAEPAKTGMFDPPAPIEYALQAEPSPVSLKLG